MYIGQKCTGHSPLNLLKASEIDIHFFTSMCKAVYRILAPHECPSPNLGISKPQSSMAKIINIHAQGTALAQSCVHVQVHMYIMRCAGDVRKGQIFHPGTGTGRSWAKNLQSADKHKNKRQGVRPRSGAAAIAASASHVDVERACMPALVW